MQPFSTPPREDPLLWSVSGLPYLVIGTFYAFVFRAWMSLGELPNGAGPGPDALGFPVHQVALIGAFHFGPLVVAVLVGVALLLAITADGPRLVRGPLTTLVLGCGLTALVVTLDPGGFVHWFLG